MEMETLWLPKSAPVMTLPSTVFFPQALLPLHIFETRYRQMLEDVLLYDRLFAVARMDPTPSNTATFEPLSYIATIGIVRASQEKNDATSHLLLQGLCRVEIIDIVCEEPYRTVSIRPLATANTAASGELEFLRANIMHLLDIRQRLGVAVPKGMTQFLETIDDPDTFADLAAFNLCNNNCIKQKLLEELDTRRRMMLFSKHLNSEITAQRLQRKLQGHLRDNHIQDN